MHHGVNLVHRPVPRYGVNGAERPECAVAWTVDRHAEIGFDAKIGNGEIAANPRVRRSILDDQRAIVAFHELAERMRQRRAPLFGPGAGQADLAFEKLTVAFLFDKGNQRDRDFQDLRHQFGEFVKGLICGRIDEAELYQKVGGRPLVAGSLHFWIRHFRNVEFGHQEYPMKTKLRDACPIKVKGMTTSASSILSNPSIFLVWQIAQRSIKAGIRPANRPESAVFGARLNATRSGIRPLVKRLSADQANWAMPCQRTAFRIGVSTSPGASIMDMPRPNPAILSNRNSILARLRAILPDDSVIGAPAETRAYECDALSAYACLPLAVVLPRSTAEVSAVLAACSAMGVPVVPRGAGTSLAGGALPTADCVVLGVARMNEVIEVDVANRFIRVQSGRTNLSVTGAVEAAGFFYAPDPSSQLACAIAGNIAMNSGGAHCLKYGVTTNNLMGVTLVQMDGTVVTLGGPWMDQGGLDLLGVICGSEGQLGVVTEAWLRILPKPEGARPVLIGFTSNEVAGACVADIIKAGLLPVAIEFMDRPCIRATEAFAHAGYPDCEALLIVEVEGSDGEIDEQLARIKAIAARHDPVELRESRSEEESRKIWLGRKSAFGAMGSINDYMCLDGVIPVSALAAVLRRIGQMSRECGLDVANVFHAGDGNLHPLILYDANTPGDLGRCEALGADILRLCVEVGGCLTGEHGVGVEKRDLMSVQFSDVDLEAQMRVKDVFDPGWLLNPAKVFPLALSAGRRQG